jgi:hypothetical protein
MPRKLRTKRSSYYLMYLCLYVCLLVLQPVRYHSLVPTIPIYPNNREDAKRVKEFVRNRQEDDIRLFELTDPSVVYAFVTEVPETLSDLQLIISRPQVIVPNLCLKYAINRARPKQVDPTIQTLHSETASTPAYPSGHAYQAYYLAHILSQRYPEKTQSLWSLAERCAHSRVVAGLHYPSDNECSKTIVRTLY